MNPTLQEIQAEVTYRRERIEACTAPRSPRRLFFGARIFRDGRIVVFQPKAH